MHNDQSLLDRIITDYFNSINQQFEYRRKNNWKINLSLIFFSFSIFFTIINIIPLFPGLFNNLLYSIFLIVKPHLIGTIFENYTFYTKWILGVSFSSLFLIITFPFYKFWNNRANKYSLNATLLPFCYVFKSRIELKNYLINENFQHLENSKSLLSRYFPKLSYKEYETDGSQKTINAHIGEITSQLKKNYPWIRFEENTNTIIDAISSVNEKIIESLIQKINIDEILPIIEDLVLYEFASIKRNELSSDGKTLFEKRFIYLLCFSKSVISLEDIVIVKEKNNSSKIKFLELINGIPKLFASNSIFIMFLSWLILLIVLLIPLTLIVAAKLNLGIDSTILTSIITLPFIGAITIVASRHNNIKKRE